MTTGSVTLDTPDMCYAIEKKKSLTGLKRFFNFLSKLKRNPLMSKTNYTATDRVQVHHFLDILPKYGILLPDKLHMYTSTHVLMCAFCLRTNISVSIKTTSPHSRSQIQTV